MKSFLPKQLLWQLTILNIIAITFFIGISSLAIYNTACVLVEGIELMNEQRQVHFNDTLLQYLWIFSIPTIILGSFIQFYLTRKLIRPLKELIESTKHMKKGHYNEVIRVESEGEMGELITHFNELIEQLRNNQTHRQKIVSDLSHEFRTPLSNLNGYLNALSNGVIEGNKELFHSLHGESKRLTSMVEQLEQLKEWDYVSSQTFMEKEVVDISLVIEQSVEMFHWLLKEKGIEIEIQTESGMVNIYNGAIPQVLCNLIDNAIRYYEGNEPIKIEGEMLNSEYLVSVSGYGKVISKSENNDVFERFYRVDPSRNRDTGGTGLGLAISKEIIEHHNGEIGLNTINQNHHTFWFTLPLYKET